MLDVKPHVDSTHPAARYLWYSPNLQFKFVLLPSYELEVWMREVDHYRQINCIPRQLILPEASLDASDFANFHYNPTQRSISWLRRTKIILISDWHIHALTKTMYSPQILHSHQISHDGKFLIAESKYEMTSGLLTESGPIGFVYPAVYVTDLATNIYKKISDTRAYALKEDTLYLMINFGLGNRLLKYPNLKNLSVHEQIFANFPGRVSCICVSDDQQKLACAVKTFEAEAPYCIYLYDLVTNTQRQKFTEINAWVKEMYFTPSGNRLVCLTTSAPLLPALPNRYFNIYVFTLSDPRQSYHFSLPPNSLVQLIHGVEENKVQATCNNQLLTWELSPRQNEHDRLCFHLTNKHGQALQINGVKLLKLAHAAVKELLDRICPAEVTPDLHQITEGQSWLKLAGRLAKCIASSDKRFDKKLFGSIVVGHAAIHQTQVNISQNEIVRFVGQAGDYVTISRKLAKFTEQRMPSFEEKLAFWDQQLAGTVNPELKEKFINRRHAELANILLGRLQLQAYPDSYSLEDKNFLDTLLVLMFGVESSRVNATYLIGVMLLDLTTNMQVYGRLHRPYSWDNAFISGPSYRWNDFEHKVLGGKFPLATTSTGPGNFKHRADILKEESDDSQSLQKILTEPQHHQIPKKEISLIIHWLQSLQEHQKNYLQDSANGNVLANKIKFLFQARLQLAYNLPHKENARATKFTALHSGYYNLQQPNSDAEISRQFIHYYLLIKNETTGETKIEPYYHRTDVPCKLINPAYTRGEEKIITTGHGSQTTRGHPNLVQRKLIGIKKILNLNGINNQASPQWLIDNGQVTLKPNNFGPLYLNREFKFNSQQSAQLRRVIIKFLRECELPYYHYGASGYVSDDERAVVDALRFESITDNEAQITLTQIDRVFNQLINPPADNPPKRGRLMLDSNERLLTNIINQLLPTINIGIDVSHYKFNYSLFGTLAEDTFLRIKNFIVQNFADFLADQALQSILQTNLTVAENYQGDPILPADYLPWLVFSLCERANYQFERVYSCQASGQELQPCPKCYSETSPCYPGLPYNYPNMVCFVYASDPHYHRIFLDENQETICPVIKYDIEQGRFYYHPLHPCTNLLHQQITCHYSSTQLNLQFVASATKQGKQPCPACWWVLR